MAIDSKMLFGNTWVMKFFRFSDEVLRSVVALASGSGSEIASPGRSRLAITRPISSEHSEAPRNQTSALPPMRPTVLPSPMPARPATRVASTSGAMIILIMRRKMSVRIEK